jgi:signal transduction histidine kinase
MKFIWKVWIVLIICLGIFIPKYTTGQTNDKEIIALIDQAKIAKSKSLADAEKLLSQAEKHIQSSTKKEVLNDYYHLYATLLMKQGKYLEGIQYYQKLEKTALATQDFHHLFIAYNGMGLSKLYQGFFNESLVFLLKSDSLATQYKLKGHEKVKMDLANVYLQLAKYSEALDANLQAIKAFTINKDTINLIYGYATLGSIYTNIEKDYEAISSYNKALEFNKIYKEPDLDVQIYSNYGLIYMGKKDKLDSAIYFFEKALSLIENHTNSTYSLIILSNLGATYYEKGEIKKSIKLFNSSLNNPLIQGRPHVYEAVCVNLSQSYFDLNQMDSSYRYAKLGVEKGKEIGELEFRINGLNLLVKIDSIHGDWQQMTVHQNEYFQALIKRNQDASEEKIVEIMHDLEMEHQTIENFRLREEAFIKGHQLKRTRLTVALMSFTLLIVVILLISINRLRLSSQKINQKLILSNVMLEKNTLLLEQANKTKDKFFSLIGHDLKNPFSSLIGVLDELRINLDSFSKEEQLNLLELLSNSSKNAYELLENLLEWGQSQSALIQAKTNLIDVNKLIKNILNLYGEQSRQKEIQIKMVGTFAQDIYTDEHLLHTIIRNFVSNAIKYSHPTQSIEIRLSENDEEYLIEVCDFGMGMSQKSKDLILAGEFLDKTPGTAMEMGTGLGMKIVKEFSSLLNARFSIRDNAPQGTIFCLGLKK